MVTISEAETLELMELIQFRINELLEGKDFERTFPTYQEMLQALFEIKSLIK